MRAVHDMLVNIFDPERWEQPSPAAAAYAVNRTPALYAQPCIPMSMYWHVQTRLPVGMCRLCLPQKADQILCSIVIAFPHLPVDLWRMCFHVCLRQLAIISGLLSQDLQAFDASWSHIFHQSVNVP